jgi:uncharacterized protein
MENIDNIKGINSNYSSIKPDKQYVTGYLGNWIKKNITHEILVFPIEDYLFPYYTYGLTIGTWTPEEFLGKYLETMAFTYQYADKYDMAPFPTKLLKNRMDQIVNMWINYQSKNKELFSTYLKEYSEADEGLRLWNAKYVILGLLSYYELFRDKDVLQLALRIGEQMIHEYGENGIKPITNASVGTAGEAFIKLYYLTEEQKYLDFCRWIMQTKVESEVVNELLYRSGKVYNITPCHSYTVLAICISILDLYICQGGPDYYLQA